MIIVLKPGADDAHVEEITDILKARGLGVHLSRGESTTIIGAIGAVDEEKGELAEQLVALDYVDRVVPISKPYKVVRREFRPGGTVLNIRGAQIGGGKLCVMAGPCTVENPQMLFETARYVKEQGAHVLRGGAFKPSTSPYSFHGMGEEGLQLLAEARDQTGLPVITEVMDTRDVEMVCKYTDILQVGTPNMANFSLLREIGDCRTPVMLKRGWASKIEEWLQGAEYIAGRGNYDITLCERGIRTFETYPRNTFDINAIPAVKELSDLPIIADSPHGTGKWSLVNAVARASVAAGANDPVKRFRTYESLRQMMGSSMIVVDDDSLVLREQLWADWKKGSKRHFYWVNIYYSGHGAGICPTNVFTSYAWTIAADRGYDSVRKHNCWNHSNCLLSLCPGQTINTSGTTGRELLVDRNCSAPLASPPRSDRRSDHRAYARCQRHIDHRRGQRDCNHHRSRIALRGRFRADGLRLSKRRTFTVRLVALHAKLPGSRSDEPGPTGKTIMSHLDGVMVGTVGIIAYVPRGNYWRGIARGTCNDPE